MSTKKKLRFTTQKFKVKDLVPLDFNPRKITEHNKKKLIESLKEFDLVEIPVINTDKKLVAGNQRITALMVMERGEEEIDVRVPNRKMTIEEIKKYNILSNTHAGEFDFEMLDMHFGDMDLMSYGMELDPRFCQVIVDRMRKLEPEIVIKINGRL